MLDIIKTKLQEIIEGEFKKFDFTTDLRIDAHSEDRATVALNHDSVTGEKFFSFAESLRVKLEEEGFEVKDSTFFYSYYLMGIEKKEE